jgi:hypothetical protein
VDDPVVAPTPEAVSAEVPEAVNPPAPAKKKRGFWSRLFGIGRGDESDDKNRPREQPPKKKSGG